MSPAVDPRVLARLVADLGTTSVSGLVGTYLDALPDRRAKLAEASSSGDLQAAKYVAHQLRSTSDLVGALRLGEACAWLEAVAVAGDDDGVAQAADEVVRLSGDVARGLQSWLAGDR